LIAMGNLPDNKKNTSLDLNFNIPFLEKLIEKLPTQKLKGIHVFSIISFVLLGILILVYPKYTGNILEPWIWPIYIFYVMFIVLFFIVVDYLRKGG